MSYTMHFLCATWPIQVNFNWGTGAVTPYGRDHVSVRWEGKLMAPSSETFTLYLRADDAAVLSIDHEVVIDAWEGTCEFHRNASPIPWFDFVVA